MGNSPVIAIGLDSAPPDLLEQYMQEGHLPVMAKLRASGAYGRLRTLESFCAETPWTTFLSGCSPQKTGYWSPLKLREGTYDVDTISAYDFERFPPFYALGPDYRVTMFDVPQVRVRDDVPGLQVSAWGAHSPQVPSASLPEGLLGELTEKHGNHPGLHKDFAECLDLDRVEKLIEVFDTGIRRRAAICRDLMEREPWDLFLTVFGEPHGAGHTMWQVSQPDHPLYEALHPRFGRDLMLDVYVAIDRAIGQILEKAPSDARVVVFSAHGMGPNTTDLPSTVFLPELLYRHSFPGETQIGAGDPNAALGAPLLHCLRDSFVWEVWANKTDRNRLRRWARQRAPWGLFKRIERALGPAADHDLIAPWRLAEQTRSMPQQAAHWYKPCWPRMKAFALPSFSEGYIRINLQGREPNGQVTPAEYDSVCSQLIEELSTLRDARTGLPMVKEAIRTRKNGDLCDPDLPDPDIVVIWQSDHATDVVESPKHGRIGPVPYVRAGGHRPDGFLIAAGSGVPMGKRLPLGHALDLPPTLLRLLGAPIAEHLEGTPLL